MPRPERLTAALLASCLGLPGLLPAQSKPRTFSGASALAYTAKLAALGPRPPGSAPHGAAQKLIVSQLKSFGCQVEQDPFTAQSPLGPEPMNNIIGKVPGKSGRLVVFSGHYDTKYMPAVKFVGANDGGSSAGFLLELARVLCGRPSTHDIYLAFFDGEEAIREWSNDDSLYGSRRLARLWRQNGTIQRMIGLINVDMIGDADLQIVNDQGSTAWLRNLIWQCAGELGYSKHFDRAPGGVTDDHVPFLEAGATAVELIDFSYGPGNSYWHTASDTVDKLSARSFQIVGDVLLRALGKL